MRFSRVAERQQKQKDAHDSKACDHSFEIGDAVYACAYGRGQSHRVTTTVVHTIGPVSYRVQLGDYIIYRRHQDQLRRHFDVQVPVPVSVAAATSPSNVAEPLSSTPVLTSKPHPVPERRSPEPRDYVTTLPPTVTDLESCSRDHTTTSLSTKRKTTATTIDISLF